MERLRQRVEAAEKTLTFFGKLATIKKPNGIERDAAIQRFEFSFEASWKGSQAFQSHLSK